MIGIVIQARMGANRLPGKVLLEFCGKPVLWHVVERCRQSKIAQKVIVATTDQVRDDAIERFCRDHQIDYFRGSEEDVLERYFRCAEHYRLTTIIRVTADCPLLDPEIMDQTIRQHLETRADYSTNRLKPTFPDGLDVDVLSWECLSRVFKDAKKRSEREHVVPYIWNHPEEFIISEYRSPTDWSHYRWTLDEPEDFEFLKKIYEHLYRQGKGFNIKDVLELIKKNPEWCQINSQFIRDEGYHKSVQSD